MIKVLIEQLNAAPPAPTSSRLDRDGEKELASGNATARPQIIRSAPDFSGRRRHATAIDSTAERTQFSELAACALHLTAIDVPLLASYAQSIVLCRRVGRDGSRVDLWQKLIRAQAMLARSLRLTPQSHREQAAGRRQQAPGSDPW
jgi:hypothetical protein